MKVGRSTKATVGVALLGGAAAWYFASDYGRGPARHHPPQAQRPEEPPLGQRMTSPTGGNRLSRSARRVAGFSSGAPSSGPTPSATPPAAVTFPAEIVEIRKVLNTNPHLAEQLIYADRERSPNSPYADERDALLVSALQNDRRPADARAEAERYLRSHPTGRYIDYVIRTTGAQPEVSSPRIGEALNHARPYNDTR